MEWNRQLKPTPWLVLAGLVTLVSVARSVDVAGQAATGQTAQVTFTKDIAPILQRSCQDCHRPGSVAPMSLISYEEVRPWARAIKHRTSLGSSPEVMPPWYVDKSIGIQRFKDDMSLSDAEIAKIAAWADAGAPRGNPADMPPPRKFADASEWRLGTPDLIVRSPIVEVASTQPDWWGQLEAVPTGLTEDRYVASVEMKEITDFVEAGGEPGRKTVGGQAIMHHAAFSPRVVGGTGAASEAPVSDAGGYWPVHEAGRNPDVFDLDAGKLLRAKSEIAFMSVHVHANGRRTKAHLEIGFKFHPKGYKPKKTLVEYNVASRAIDLRGNEANQVVEGFLVLRENLKMTYFEPHMHAAGVKMCLDAIWGWTAETISCVGYNHGWVRIYTFADDAQPLLPKGTILRARGYYDLTSANKNISDPRNWAGLGNRSIDNMMSGITFGVELTDEEFEQELEKRREHLRLTGEQDPIGCPLCGSENTKNTAKTKNTARREQ